MLKGEFLLAVCSSGVIVCDHQQDSALDEIIVVTVQLCFKGKAQIYSAVVLATFNVAVPVVCLHPTLDLPEHAQHIIISYTRGDSHMFLHECVDGALVVTENRGHGLLDAVVWLNRVEEEMDYHHL